MIRVLVVDDHTLVRDSLCRLLDAEDDMEVAGRTGSGHEAVSLVQRHEPDVGVLDYSRPDPNGLPRSLPRYVPWPGRRDSPAR